MCPLPLPPPSPSESELSSFGNVSRVGRAVRLYDVSAQVVEIVVGLIDNAAEHVLDITLYTRNTFNSKPADSLDTVSNGDCQ